MTNLRAAPGTCISENVTELHLMWIYEALCDFNAGASKSIKSRLKVDYYTSTGRWPSAARLKAQYSGIGTRLEARLRLGGHGLALGAWELGFRTDEKTVRRKIHMTKI